MCHLTTRAGKTLDTYFVSVMLEMTLSLEKKITESEITVVRSGSKYGRVSRCNVFNQKLVYHTIIIMITASKIHPQSGYGLSQLVCPSVGHTGGLCENG